MPGPGAAGEARPVGDEELVDQARLEQVGVQVGAALAEQAADARARRAGSASASVMSTRPSWRITRTVVAVSGGSSSEAVKISTRPPPFVNSSASQGRFRRPETITISGSWGRPRRSRAARLLGIAEDPAVALGPHRPRADHHRLGDAAQADQHRRVRVGADRPGAAVDRRVAVDA